MEDTLQLDEIRVSYSSVGDIWNFESVDFYCVINTIEIIFRATKKENYLLQPCAALFQQPIRAFLGINDE